jgi:hypothetical protein
MTLERTLALANPVLDREVRLLVPQEWSDETLSGILGEAPPELALRSPFARRARLLVLVVLALAALALPTYAIGRAVKSWLSGEPAPPSIVHNFGSYAPQLGFHPEPGNAVRVAADGGFILYATQNDRGSYCVATSTPDGGICILPRIAEAPLIAGIMPDDPRRADARRTILVAGRVNDPSAVAIAFTDPDGATVTRQIGSGGFFLVALPTAERALGGSPYPCKNGDWIPTFRAIGQTGVDLVAAQITLASRPPGAPPGVVCGWGNGPHS